MSYFNEEDEKQNIEPQPSPLSERLRREEEDKKMREAKRNKGSKFGYFLTGFTGILLGALLVWLMLPSLADQLPGNSTATSNTSNSNKTSISQNATTVTTDVTKAVEKASGAVVGITNIQTTQSISGLWGQSSGEQTEAGSGSGVIYKVDGNTAYIATNHHVVDGAEKLEVTLADGVKVDAQLIGSDIWTDLAVIAIDSKDVTTVAKFGDSDVLKQGEPVIAIGNPLGLDFYGSVTTGVVSGTDRSVPVDLNEDGYEDWSTDVLQTDAAINPGNSGGALVNINGEVIGINSMKIAEDTVEGLGFAIPVNSALPVIEELERNGEVERPTMGVSLVDLTEVPSYYQQQQLNLPKEVTTGVVISQVQQGSAAAKAGVQKYDVVVEMDGQKIENSIDLRKYLYNEKSVGDTLKMKVYRDGKVVELKLTLITNADL